jgi:DNA-binding MarR family transcriptional regulator
MQIFFCMTHEASPSGNNLEDQVVAAIRRLTRALDLHSRSLVSDFALTGPQVATLKEADRSGPVAASALARSVRLSAATMTGILSRLEKRGFVERSRGASDRRTVTVTVSEQGRVALARSPSLLQERFRMELSRLETWEQMMMLANLQRIASMMDTEAGDLDRRAVEASDAGRAGVAPGSSRATRKTRQLQLQDEQGHRILNPPDSD